MSIRVLLGLSLLLLTLSAVFGFLNTGKVRALRTEAANANAARAIAENARIAQRRQTKGTEPSANSNNAQTGDEQARLATAEAEAAKAQSEKAETLAKLQSTENQLAQLQKNIQVGGTNTAESGGPTVAELQAQLDEARRELDNAEREKVFVSEKTQGDHAAPSAPRPTTQERVTRRHSSPPGLHGTILAVNQAYNFVVLNLGGRQGVQTNAELLVMRGGTQIGRIRVSSVEPATAIGDIISSSLPRGVQVQPGDTVVYVGTDS